MVEVGAIKGFLRDHTANSITFYSEEPSSTLSREHIEVLKTLACNADGVARLCLHSSPEAALHIMAIAQTAEMYWRPKKHLTKIKSFTMIEGRMAVAVFRDSGALEGVSILDPEFQPLMVVEQAIFHTNVAITPVCVHVETIQGPYVLGEEDRVVAPFAPDEGDTEAGRAFISDFIDGFLSL